MSNKPLIEKGGREERKNQRSHLLVRCQVNLAMAVLHSGFTSLVTA